MELPQLFMSVLALCCATLGWFARECYTAIKTLKNDLSALQIQIATDYIRYDRLQDALEPLIRTQTEIKQMLSQKADK